MRLNATECETKHKNEECEKLNYFLKMKMKKICGYKFGEKSKCRPNPKKVKLGEEILKKRN
jgi:hypothetical protein